MWDDVWDWLVTLSAILGAWTFVALVLACTIGWAAHRLRGGDDADR